MASRQSKLVFGVAGGVLLVILIAIAAAIASSQSNDRSDVEDRFSRRPQVSAALTSALFAATSTTPEQQKELNRRFGGLIVSQEVLTEEAKDGNNVFEAVVDNRGNLLGVSDGAPPGVRAELDSQPDYVQTVLDGDQPVALSDYLDIGPGGVPIQLFAQAIETEYGRRVLVSGFAPGLLYSFLSANLTELVDITGGQAYIIDSTGAVVASSNPEAEAAAPVPVPGLIEAVADDSVGPIPGEQYFAAAPIENSSWEVVSVAAEDDVFASVNGSHKWTPWLIFAALALAALAAFVLLWRVLRNAGELADAHTQLDASNRSLKRRAKELERSNAELDQFASIASHDLQEPLRKVQMFSQRAIEVDGDRLSEKGRDYLRRNTEAAGRMQVLIEDLLKFSRVGTQSRPFVRTDLERTAQEVVSDLETAIQAADATVEIGSLPTVVVDEPQMRQLLQNLISNAIKFRREGVPPVVKIDGEVRGEEAVFRVADNGIGFDPRYAGRIFRVFERLHGRGEYPGTGIGLALCRKIVERHGGSIGVESTPGEGSVFTVTLPLKGVSEPGFDQGAPSDDREREAVGV